MQGKEDLAAFLSALVSANQELFAIEKLQQCLSSPGFRTACSEGLLDHCHVTDPRGNVSRPLELAARRGYTLVVSELLALGASPALHSHAVTGNTPLHMAVLHGDAKMTSEMVAALQKNGGDVDVPNSNGDTALMFAMHRSAQDMHTSTTPILQLMSAGASVAVRNKSGLSALMIACTSTSAGLWKLLVHITQKDIVIQALEDCDVHGNRPLHLAARAGNTAVCESLLSWGASPFSVNNAQESPLDVALTSSHTATANKLHCARHAAIEATEEAAAQLVQKALAVQKGAQMPMGNICLPDHPSFSPVRCQSHTGSEQVDPATQKASNVPAARMHAARPCTESEPNPDTNATKVPETGGTVIEPPTSSPRSSRPSPTTIAPSSKAPAAAPAAALKSPTAAPGKRNKTTYKRSSATVLAEHPVCYHRSAIAQFFSSPTGATGTSLDTTEDATIPPPSDRAGDSRSTTNPLTTIDGLVDEWQPFTAPTAKANAKVHDSNSLFTTAHGSAHMGLGSRENSCETVMTVPMDPRDDSILSSYTRTGDFDTPSSIDSTSAVYHSETLTVPIDPSEMNAHSRVYVVEEPRTAPRDASMAPHRSYHDAARACQGGEGVMASAVGGDTTFASTYESTYAESDDDTVVTSVIDTGDRQRRMHPWNAFAPDEVPGAGRDGLQGVIPPAVASPMSPMSAAAAAAAAAVMHTAATGSPMTHSGRSGSTHGSGTRQGNMFKNSQDLSAATMAAVVANFGSGSDGLHGPPSEAGSVGSSYDNDDPEGIAQEHVSYSVPQIVVRGTQHQSGAGTRDPDATQNRMPEARRSVSLAHVQRRPDGTHSVQHNLLTAHERSPTHNPEGAQDVVALVDTIARAERTGGCASASGQAMGDAIGMQTVIDEAAMCDSRAESGAVAQREGYLLPPVCTGAESMMLEGPGPQACGERDSALDMHAKESSIKGGTSSACLASSTGSSHGAGGSSARGRGRAVGVSKDSARHIVRSTSQSPHAARAQSARSAKRVLAVLKQKADGDPKEEEFTSHAHMTLDRFMQAAERMPSSAAAAKRSARNTQVAPVRASESPNSDRRKSGVGTGAAAAYGNASEAALAAAAAAAAAGLADSPGGRESSPYAYRLNSSALLTSSTGGNTASTLLGIPPPPTSALADSFAHVKHCGSCAVEEATTPHTPVTPHTPSISRTPATPDHEDHDTPSSQQPLQPSGGEPSPWREIVREVSFRDSAIPRYESTHSPEHTRRGSKDHGNHVHAASGTPRLDQEAACPGDSKRARGHVQNFSPRQLAGHDGACPLPMHSVSTSASHSATATSTAPGTRATTATNSSTSRDASGSILVSCSDHGRFATVSERGHGEPPAIHTDTEDRRYGTATGTVYSHTDPPHKQPHKQVDQAPQRYSAMYASVESLRPPAPIANQPLKAGFPAEQSRQGVDLSPRGKRYPQGSLDAGGRPFFVAPLSGGHPHPAQSCASFLFDSAPPELYASWEAGMPIPSSHTGALRNRRYPNSTSALHSPPPDTEGMPGADMSSYAAEYRVPASPMSERGSPYAAEVPGFNACHSVGAYGDAALPYPKKRGLQGRATVDLNVLWGERSPRLETATQQAHTAGRGSNASDAATIGAELVNAGIPLHLAALMGTHPHTLTMPQLEALEDFHYQQLEKISRVKLEKHRELRRKQVQDLRKAAEMWGGLRKA